MTSFSVQSSTINSVGHDQTNNQLSLHLHGNQTITHHHVYQTAAALPNDPNTGTQLVIAGSESIQCTARCLLLLASIVNAIDKISRDLEGRDDGPDSVLSELRTVREIVVNTGLALEKEKDRGAPIQAIIARFINPELARCLTLLTALSKSARQYRYSLFRTIIARFWRRIWFHSWTEQDVETLKRALSSIRMHLQVLVSCMESIGWTDIGNAMVSGEVSTAKRMPPARGISPSSPYAYVLLIDHLGDTIPLPMQFFRSWDVFDSIMKAYYKDRKGSEYIQRGDYHLLYEGCHCLPSSALNRIVKPGMVLEMSIVLRKTKSRLDSHEICPRCHTMNPVDSAKCDWIKCSSCSGLFQVRKQPSCVVEMDSPASQDTIPPCARDAPFFRRISVIP